jgi:nicotinamide mononucleotide transporter
MSTLEIFAATVSFIAVSLGVTGKRITWPFWVVGSALYGIFFFQSDYFASAVLQIVFIAAAIAGWFGWGKKGAIPGRIKNTYRIYLLLIIGVLTLILGPLLDRIGAAATYADAVLLFASITAQMLMVYQKYEAWPMWLVINIGYTALFYSQELFLTSTLYLVFTVVAAVGWRQWYGTYRRTH